jgi:hypothetical protein
LRHWQHAATENDTSRHFAHLRCMQNGHGASGKGENDTVRIEIGLRLSWTFELSAGVFKAVLTELLIERIRWLVVFR